MFTKPRILSVALGIPFFLFSILCQASLATNLQAFTAITQDGQRYQGYAEPAKKQLGGDIPADKSRIYLFPSFTFKDNPVSLRNSNGKRIYTIEEADNATGTVKVLMDTATPSESAKMFIVAKINNCGQMPLPESRRPVFLQDTDPNVLQSYQVGVRVFDNSYSCANQYIKSYAFSAVNPIQVEMTLKIGNETFIYSSASGSFVGQSYLTINIKSNDKVIIASLLENDFTVNIKYKIPISKFASGHANFKWNEFMSIFTEKAYSSIKKTNSSGFSFLFLSNVRKSVSESVNEYAQQSSVSKVSLQSHIQVRDDSDGSILTRLISLVFPEIAKDELINRHTQAATEASQSGDSARATLHNNYIAALKADDMKGMTDVVAALGAMAKNDVLGFLANGVAFKSSSGRGTYQYRHLSNATHSGGTEQTFSNLILESLYEEMATGISPSLSPTIQQY